MFLLTSSPRYAFRSPEKVALQEIGPRFTLKLKYLKKGLPAVQNFGEAPRSLAIDEDANQLDEESDPTSQNNDQTEDVSQSANQGSIGADGPASQDEYIWIWKVRKITRI
jgi:ribosome production factor 1